MKLIKYTIEVLMEPLLSRRSGNFFPGCDSYERITCLMKLTHYRSRIVDGCGLDNPSCLKKIIKNLYSCCTIKVSMLIFSEVIIFNLFILITETLSMLNILQQSFYCFRQYFIYIYTNTLRLHVYILMLL